MAYKNPEDRKAYHKRWYEENKDRRRGQISKCDAKRLKKNRAFIDRISIFKGCCICKYNRCAKAIDFHHIDPSTKTYSIAEMARSYNIKTIKIEMRKCVTICANCHRELHDGMITLE